MVAKLHAACTTVDEEMLNYVLGNILRHAAACQRMYGRHFEHLMYRVSPLKEAPWDMCVTERGNEEIQFSVTTTYRFPPSDLEAHCAELPARYGRLSGGQHAGTSRRSLRGRQGLPPNSADLSQYLVVVKSCNESGRGGRGEPPPIIITETRPLSAGEIQSEALVFPGVNHLIGPGSRSCVAVRLLISHLGEPGSIPGGVTPDFRTWESCRTMPLIGGFSRRSCVSPALSIWRCSIFTSLHPYGLSRP
ncbi:hypothetical protein PR048_014835 [Dryococelus australis]|uniref:Uncharacterized protein n=1 Tax=Dryococelus australis TaxID=614101 RepID=A0ABQ9HFQ3_9NEOP|nr:hypothetical protein PR048_014835 [Dryococelus australis]